MRSPTSSRTPNGSSAWELLEQHRGALDELADTLFDCETVDGDDVRAALRDEATAPAPPSERFAATEEVRGA